MVDQDSQKKITADFQCFVCGAIFTSEEDRRQHLEKEMHGATEKKDIDTVKRQTELSEMHRQAYEPVQHEYHYRLSIGGPILMEILKRISEKTDKWCFDSYIAINGDYLQMGEQQQQPQLYQYSVKIEMTAKGLAMPTIHVYSNDIQTARKQAVEQYCNVIEELKAKGVPVAVLDLKP